MELIEQKSLLYDRFKYNCYPDILGERLIEEERKFLIKKAEEEYEKRLWEG